MQIPSLSRSLRDAVTSREDKKTEQRGEESLFNKNRQGLWLMFRLVLWGERRHMHVKRERVSTQRCLAYNLFMDSLTIKEKTCLWIHYTTDHLLKGCLTHAYRKRQAKKMIIHSSTIMDWHLFCNCIWKSSYAIVHISSLWRQSYIESANVNLTMFSLSEDWLPCVEVSKLSACRTFIDIMACAVS